MGHAPDWILKGGTTNRVNDKMVGLEHPRKKLDVFPAEAVEPPPAASGMAAFYWIQIAELYETRHRMPRRSA